MIILILVLYFLGFVATVSNPENIGDNPIIYDYIMCLFLWWTISILELVLWTWSFLASYKGTGK